MLKIKQIIEEYLKKKRRIALTRYMFVCKQLSVFFQKQIKLVVSLFQKLLVVVCKINPGIL